jgi:hypothetical protein
MLIMLAAGFSMMVPAAKPAADAPADEDTAAHTEIGGEYDATYTFSDMGESYLKVSDDTARGQLLGASGVNQWWYDRWDIGGYDDFVVRNKEPYVLFYNAYGMTKFPTGMVRAGYNLWTFYKIDVQVSNLMSIQTGANEDPILLPILKGGPNPQQYDGGWVNVSWHMTYLSDAECDAIDAGTHYANTYYGLPAGMGGAGSGFSGAYGNDGWYAEISGKMDFDRNAADKFLGLDKAAASLIDDFNAKNVDNAIGDAWGASWYADGSATGAYDTYCSYLYSIDPLVCWLSVDMGESTADKLVLRMWTHSWGAEALMMRYLDVTGVFTDWNYMWPEGLWINATMSPDGSDVAVNGIVQYNMGAWKDMNPNTAIKEAAWLFEPQHGDYVNDTTAHPLWISRYRLYCPSTTWKVTKANWVPGTVQWGNQVAYWYAPRNWDLKDGERIVIELQDSFWGVKPYKGASDAIGQTKANELYANGVWGEMVLGHTVPLSLYDASYYDADTKTITLEGPMDVARNVNPNPAWAKLNETGTPLVPLAVSRVSSYSMALEAQSMYYAGVPYQLTVTCLNYTGAAASGFYHNVTLSSDIAGTTFGETTHGFLPTDTNVWVTTVTFGEATSGGHVIATSGEFPLDISSDMPVVVDIPEFPLLLLPVMGAAVAVVVLLRRRNQ